MGPPRAYTPPRRQHARVLTGPSGLDRFRYPRCGGWPAAPDRQGHTPPPRPGSQLINGRPAAAEQGSPCPFETTFAALRRVIICPQRIGHVVFAALVLLALNYRPW